MNEKTWLQTADPQTLLRYAIRKLSARKNRLLAIACCREKHREILSEVFLNGLAVAEDMVEREMATFGPLIRLGEKETAVRESVMEALEVAREAERHDEWAALHDVWNCLTWVDPLTMFFGKPPTLRERFRRFATFVSYWWRFGIVLGKPQYPAGWCPLVRDIVGNPFWPVTFDPTWRTDTAVSLASQMYGSRDFGAMPILADALQDAGCTNEDILSHCRGPGPHVRGCWVVGLVIGKS
jgi:hypothetical protein